MSARFAGLLLALLLFPGTAAAQAASCGTTTEGARYGVRLAGGDGAQRSRVVVCDRRMGSERTIRRSRGIRAVSSAGRHVAWLEIRPRGYEYRLDVLRSDPAGRIRERRVVRLRSEPGEPLDVAVFLDGTVAWLRPGTATGRSARLFIARPGRRARSEVVPSAARLAVEDGRTLRLGRTPFAYRDLLPVPTRDGCPVRRAFRVVETTPTHVTSLARYARDGGELDVTRVCVSGAGLDPVVARDFSDAYRGNRSAILGLAGELAAIRREPIERSTTCRGSLETFDLRTERVRRRRFVSNSCTTLPSEADPLALTAQGSIAWRSTVPGGVGVLALGAGADIVELDPGPAGSITDLAAGPGETFRWRRDGEPRSAPAP